MDALKAIVPATTRSSSVRRCRRKADLVRRWSLSSGRTYRDELDRLTYAEAELRVIHTLTRSQPSGWTGYARRIDDRMLAEVVEPLGITARAYVCGPTALVEVCANALIRLGLPAARIRTERFGPTGT
jgi:ferredoxin-NADP reductase